MEWLEEQVRWMQWSLPSAIFFLALFFTLFGMGIWEGYRPCVPRKGFLPMVTTRGDRLFLGIISTIGICMLWIGLFKGVLMILPLVIAAVWFFVLAKWG